MGAGDTLLAPPWEYVRKGTVDVRMVSVAALSMALIDASWQE
ncbi:hypothetical protein [Albibacterium profundi]|uniref:Uncharacterized protein n=1 Tax=Albibacterium profundi TaxID=3134906 RepID=A0ABV5CK29_9SPHI